MPDLIIDTLALRRAAEGLLGVASAVQAGSAGVLAAAEELALGLGNPRADEAARVFAHRWGHGLSVIRADAGAVAAVIDLAAQVFEDVEEALSRAVSGSSGTPVTRTASLDLEGPSVAQSVPVRPTRMPSSHTTGLPGWAQLASARDARGLVPGDPGVVESVAGLLRRFAIDAHAAGGGLHRLASGGWSGATAEAVAEAAAQLPPRLEAAATSFDTAAGALLLHADALRHAQMVASRAIEAWARASAMSKDTAVGSYPDIWSTVWEGAAPPPALDTPDGQEAIRLLAAAQAEATESADGLSAALRRAAEDAPHRPGFWSRVGGALSDLGSGLTNAAGDVLRVLGAVGVAAVDHPEDPLLLAAGIAVMAASAAGASGGLALSATGVGAIAGVPLAAASAVGIAAGAGMVYAAADDLAARTGAKLPEGSPAAAPRFEPIQVDRGGLTKMGSGALKKFLRREGHTEHSFKQMFFGRGPVAHWDIFSGANKNIYLVSKDGKYVIETGYTR